VQSKRCVLACSVSKCDLFITSVDDFFVPAWLVQSSGDDAEVNCKIDYVDLHTIVRQGTAKSPVWFKIAVLRPQPELIGQVGVTLVRPKLPWEELGIKAQKKRALTDLAFSIVGWTPPSPPVLGSEQQRTGATGPVETGAGVQPDAQPAQVPENGEVKTGKGKGKGKRSNKLTVVTEWPHIRNWTEFAK